jgi:ABC-type sugar transport system substrate-binding protein
MTFTSARFIHSRKPVVVALAVVLLFAACGNDATDGGASGSGSGAPEDSQALDEARQRVEELKEDPASIPVSEPLEKLPQGKDVIYVHCGAGICDVYSDSMEDAAPLLGIKFRVLQPGTTPEEIVDTYNRAIQLDPDGLILAGNANLDFIGEQFQTLVDNGAKLVAHAIPQSPQDTPGLLASVEPSEAWVEKGALLADIVAVDAADNNLDANVAFFTIRDFPVFLDLEKGLEDEFPLVCPECNLETINVSAGDIGQALPTEVTGYLQANPDTNYLIFALGAMTLGVRAAIDSAGVGDEVEGRVVTQSGTPVNYEDIAAGWQLADITTEADQGWILLDQLARAMTGQETDPDARAQKKILVAENLHSDISQQWPGSPNFREEFRRLWGVEE